MIAARLGRGHQAAFAALRIEPRTGNLCSVVAVTEQESTFASDPRVPGLGSIALEEIDRRMSTHHISAVGWRARRCRSNRRWPPPGSQRIEAATTERELSDIYEAMIDRVPMGRRLLASSNPVHTGGPMQVSVSFAEQLAGDRDYPVSGPGLHPT